MCDRGGRVKVSVIVPIYRVAQTIGRCAESLFSQTLDEMQFVFVDDGSPDESCAILREVLKRYPGREDQTLIIRHDGNRGLPTARETGLRHVVGTYVAHCDSDDWVERTMYATLYESAVSNDADMVICESYHDRVDGSVWRRQTLPPDGDRIRGLLRGDLDDCVWCRLTKTDIYRKVRFPRKNFLEDWVQTIQVLSFCRVVNLVHQPLYHYCIGDASIPRKVGTDGNKMDVEAVCLRDLGERVANLDLMRRFALENGLADGADFIARKIQVRNILFPLLAMGKGRSLYLATYPEINRRILFDRRVSRLQKVIFLAVLFRLFPLAYRLRATR